MELRACISESLRQPTVTMNKAPHWALQNRDDIMAFMMFDTHLNRKVHTAGDLSDLVQQGIGSYPQTLRNKGKGSGRAPKTASKTTFTILLATEKGTFLEQ